MRRKVALFESLLRERGIEPYKKDYSLEEIREISRKNMKEIRKALKLPERDKRISLDERLCRLDGFLKEYANDKTSSVDLVHEAREDW